MNVKFTHQKHPYFATAIQWNNGNLDKIAELFPPPIEIQVHDRGELGVFLLIRMVPGEVRTLHPGYWAVRGEDGAVNCYSDAAFKLKYPEIQTK